MNRKLTDEERLLWERVRRTVQPLASGRPPRPARPAAVARKSAETGIHRRQETAPSRPGGRMDGEVKPQRPAATHTPFEQPALDQRTRRRLARGTISPDARLDLHGLDQRAAIAALEHFLRARQAAGNRLVLVITGKGSRDGGGILRRKLPHWLALPRFRELVIGFDEASRRHGGGGAFYIRLRRSRG